jgi:hypothetical protein
MKKSLFMYGITWAAVVAWFWIMYNNVNPMDYSIITFYLVLPLAAILWSAYMSANSCSFKECAISTIVMGFGFELCYYFTFSLANMIAMDRINRFSFMNGCMGMLIPLVGLILGLFVRAFKRR